MGNLIKQPNGRYCKVDYNGRLDFYNYSEQDIIDMYVRQAKIDMDNAKHYGELMNSLNSSYVSMKKSLYNEHLKKMGFEKDYDELIKLIPRKPVNTTYAACDFTTYGYCPSCQSVVQNGIGKKDEKCKCGQLLEW